MGDVNDKGGRPRFSIDYKSLEKLCGLHCTGEECAAFLGCDYDTLNKNLIHDGHGGFTDYFKKHSAAGKISLRRKQFEAATDGNVTMLIWLGKQFLAQSDKSSHEVSDTTPRQKQMTADELRDELKQLGVDPDKI